MLNRMLKLTTVLFVLVAFLVVPTSTIFSARYIDKQCTNLTRTYMDGGNEVANGCSNYSSSGEDVCAGKSLSKTVTTGDCDTPGEGYVCVLTPVTDEVEGTIQCRWIPPNPNGYPTEGYCSETSTNNYADNVSDCSHHLE